METEIKFDPKVKGCTFNNGDVATGEWYQENGEYWYRATDKQGREYETNETPKLLTLVRFAEGTPESEVNEVFAMLKEIQHGKH